MYTVQPFIYIKYLQPYLNINADFEKRDIHNYIYISEAMFYYIRFYWHTKKFKETAWPGKKGPSDWYLSSE